MEGRLRRRNLDVRCDGRSEGLLLGDEGGEDRGDDGRQNLENGCGIRGVVFGKGREVFPGVLLGDGGEVGEVLGGEEELELGEVLEVDGCVDDG